MVVSEPDIIGPIVVPAVPTPSGMMPVGDYLPPRKKWLNFYMAEMGQLIPLMQGELASTAIPADKRMRWPDRGTNAVACAGHAVPLQGA